MDARGHNFEPDRFRTLATVAETLLPPADGAWRATVAERADALLYRTHPEDLGNLGQLLGLLESPAVNLLSIGRAQRFSAMMPADREKVLRALARSPLSTIRGGFAALKRLIAIAYYAAESDGRNPVWPALGYPGPIAPSPAIAKVIQPLPINHDVTLDCDVAIVGSGAGGGMVARELAAAGRNVLVLEKGGYFNESDFSQREVAMLDKLYWAGGFGASVDQGVVCQAGECLGGGTVVNFTTSFRTPDAVRTEWTRVSGLDLFTSDDFTRSLDAASERLGVNADHNEPSQRDTLLERGLHALGWHAGRMPRDVVGCTQDDVCGYCGLGCVRGAKRSSLAACLPDAQANGARFVVDCDVERVTIENGRATGVVARTKNGHRVTVRAKTVVVAAGTIQSPAVLLRSGVAGPVGDNLRLHPATAVWGSFDEPVRPWTGTLQAVYSNQLADLDGGYGVRFETAPIHPLLMSFAVPWDGATDFDRRVRRLEHTSHVGLLLRDRQGGRVRLGRNGRALIHYAISRYDQRHIRQATAAAARVLRAAGAREIYPTQNRYLPLQAGDTVEEWLERVDRVGYGANRTYYVSFHQMGTCRMGANPQTSVVNGDGETHAVRNLYVADGSLFPTASGVNPMLTIAALGHYVAGRIARR
jgi:long-chain-alcohol oxidase